MPSQEDIEAQQELLAAHRRTLTRYLKQAAQLGEVYTPPGVVEGIREARDNIKHIKNTLRTLGADFEDHPDDEEIETPPSSPPQLPQEPKYTGSHKPSTTISLLPQSHSWVAIADPSESKDHACAR